MTCDAVGPPGLEQVGQTRLVVGELRFELTDRVLPRHLALHFINEATTPANLKHIDGLRGFLDALSELTQWQGARFAAGSVTKDRHVPKLVAQPLLMALPLGVDMRDGLESPRERALASTNAQPAAVVVAGPKVVEAWPSNPQRRQQRVRHTLVCQRLPEQRRLTPPAAPNATHRSHAVLLSPIDAEVKHGAVRLAVLINPALGNFLLQDAGAKRDAIIAEEFTIREHLPDRPSVGSSRDRHTQRRRRFVEEAVEVSVLNHGVCEQERRVRRADPLNHPMRREERGRAAGEENDVFHTLIIQEVIRWLLRAALGVCLAGAVLLGNGAERRSDDGTRNDNGSADYRPGDWAARLFVGKHLDAPSNLERGWALLALAEAAERAPAAKPAIVPGRRDAGVVGNVYSNTQRSDAIQAIVCQLQYAWPCAEAVSVVMCESGGNWGAISADGQNIGGLQINLVHGYSVAYLLVREHNIAVGYALWLDQGWSPWACAPGR